MTNLRRLIDRFVLVNAIGLAVGVGVWLYGQEISLVNGLRLQLASELPRWLVLPLLGMAGGAVAGGLISGLSPAAGGSGIVQVLLWLRGHRIPMGWRVAWVKLLASGIAIGSGLPVGPEGPAIQIGASVARETADAFGGGDRRVAVAIGSGAGLAAVFHAPLGGLAYILEELLGRATPRLNAMAAFATFAAVLWTRLLSDSGTGPLLWRNLIPIESFPTAINELRLIDLPLLLLVGAGAGLLASPYQWGILAMRHRLKRWRLPAWQLLPLAGLLIGLGWSLLPTSFDDPNRMGFEALLGHQDAGHALVALLVQGLGTALAVAADAPGGFLAPALVVGASFGALVERVCELLFHYAPSTLLFAGGAAFLGALTRTPLTAVLLSFELSKDYTLLLPIGFCTLTAVAVADLLERRSFFEVLLEEARSA